jgi:flavin reductase (DIM6/NTAB) family NADH-FMN oxidoreductase RutF
MSVDNDTFRAALGRFPTGVTVVSAVDSNGSDCGMTVSAFCSLSLDPPLVLSCIGHEATMHPVISGEDHFGVSVLAADQEAISRRFADPDMADRFDGVGVVRGSSGVSLIEGAVVHLECTVVERHWGGDHTIVVGEVNSIAVFEREPLLYHRGGYGRLGR